MKSNKKIVEEIEEYLEDLCDEVNYDKHLEEVVQEIGDIINPPKPKPVTQSTGMGTVATMFIINPKKKSLIDKVLRR